MSSNDITLEGSIYHFFLWKHSQALDQEKSLRHFMEEGDKQDGDDHRTVEQLNTSEQAPELLSTKYQKILKLIAVEFPHISCMFPPSAAKITPEICKRYTRSTENDDDAEFSIRKRKRTSNDGEAGDDDIVESNQTFAHYYDLVSRYFTKYQHYRIPFRSHPELATWVKTIRESYEEAIKNPEVLTVNILRPTSATQLTYDRIELLNQIEFEWASGQIGKNTNNQFSGLSTSGNLVGPERRSDQLVANQEKAGFIMSRVPVHYYNGCYKRVPADWRIPSCTLAELWRQWWIGDSVRQIPPLRFIETGDIKHLNTIPISEEELKKRTGKHKNNRRPVHKILSDIRFLMKFIQEKVVAKGAFVEEITAESVDQMFEAVVDFFDKKVSTKRWTSYKRYIRNREKTLDS